MHFDLKHVKGPYCRNSSGSFINTRNRFLKYPKYLLLVNVSGTTVPIINTEMRLVDFQTLAIFCSTWSCQVFFPTAMGIFLQQLIKNLCKMALALVAVHGGVPRLRIAHNHVIGWDQSKVIGTEQDRYKRWIKETIEIRKRGDSTMNRDEGQYHLRRRFDVESSSNVKF